MPVMTIEVLARLAAADPWSFTVLDTLRRKECLEAITEVTRLKSWRLAFEAADPAAALQAGDRLARETGLVVNPNRDLWCVRSMEGRTGPQSLWRRQERSADAFVVRVTDREDLAGEGLLRVLRSRLGMKEAREAAFAHLWILETDVGEPDSRAIAQEVAVCRSWRHGLLSNPHFQCADVFKAESYLPFDQGRASGVSA
jgi:hypothetical protein